MTTSLLLAGAREEVERPWIDVSFDTPRPSINPVASALKRGVIRQRIEVEDVAESDEDTATFASELAGELLEDH